MTDKEQPEHPEIASENETTALDSGTLITKPASENSRELMSQLMNASQQADTLSVMLPGSEKPLVFRGDQTLLIGRRDDTTNTLPQIDLSRYYGILMGVSRKHAEIMLKEGRCFIRDLNSSNGTWLNEARLVPEQLYALNNGDQVRLGQLLLLVFITAKANQQQTETAEVASLFLSDETQRNDQTVPGIFPAYLVNTIGAYLQALAEIQRIIREAQADPGKALAFQSMVYHAGANVIQIDLLNGADLVKFLQRRFQHLEEYYSDSMLELFADQLLKELVFRFLYEKRQDTLEQLKPLLRTLFHSPLRIAPPAYD